MNRSVVSPFLRSGGSSFSEPTIDSAELEDPAGRLLNPRRDVIAITSGDVFERKIRRDQSRTGLEMSLDEEIPHRSALPFREIPATGSEVIEKEDLRIDSLLYDSLPSGAALLGMKRRPSEHPLLARP